jgi:hypothetical protein
MFGDGGVQPVKKKYAAILFRQREGSPLQVAFAAASSEIDAWARVPTKRTGNVRNFQRAEVAKHSGEIARFFSDARNSSPTAVVVGFDAIRAKHRVVTCDEKGNVLKELVDEKGNVLKESDVVAGTPVIGSIEIEWGEDDDVSMSHEQIARIAAVTPEIREFIYSEVNEITGLDRSKATTLESYLIARLKAGCEPDASADGEQSQSELDDDVTDDAEQSTSELPFGNDAPEDIQASLAGLSPSERQVVQGRLTFLATISPEVLQTKATGEIAELFRMAMDELKPGILIDGQHRVTGTKKLGQVPFLVTALPVAKWSELAFQFIVTNRTAKRVPESLLISIVGNSLSKEQRSQIEERLRNAGIRVGLIEAVMKAHEDEESPFHGWLAFGLKDEPGFLDAAAMRGKVIQPWYERRGSIRYLFDHFCQGKRRSERTEYWQSEELWFQYFVAFWSGVKNRYDGSAVFSPELNQKGDPTSKLMTATVLMIFQHTILKHLETLYKALAGAQNTSVAKHISGETQFADIVRNTLQRLTPDFFTEWHLSGFDGSKGAQEDLQEAITLVIGSKKTVAQLKDKNRPHRLFKEQTK